MIIYIFRLEVFICGKSSPNLYQNCAATPHPDLGVLQWVANRIHLISYKLNRTATVIRYGNQYSKQFGLS